MFEGFPPETFVFLKGLAKNNTKAWFDEHRDDHEQFHLAPAKAFVEAIGPGLKKISKAINAEPQVNGSIFRINRDVRFSKDKRPYKTTLDLWFWEGEKRGWEAPGFYLRLKPDGFMAALRCQCIQLTPKLRHLGDGQGWALGGGVTFTYAWRFAPDFFEC